MKSVCIIVNYNDPENTIAHLERIRSYSCFRKIIVVDNASTDDSVSRIEAVLDDHMILVRSEKNGGYGAGNNLGLMWGRRLGAKYALIANPDTFYEEETVQILESRMEKIRRLAVCAPLMHMSDAEGDALIPGTRANVLRSPSAWPIRPWFYELLEAGPVCRRVFTRTLHYPARYYRSRETVMVGSVPGCLLMTDIEKLLEVGGYDEEMFLYGEETALGYRLKHIGYLTGLIPGITFVHDHKAAAPDIRKQKLRTESMLHYFKKYQGLSGFKLFFAKLFLKIVELETRAASKETAKGAGKPADAQMKDAPEV